MDRRTSLTVMPSRAASGCCSAAAAPEPPRHRSVDGAVPSAVGSVPRLSPAWSWRDRLEHARCRLGAFRNHYRVAPGLYAVGRPDRDAEVIVTANYGLTFDVVRRALGGLDVWLLVLDTRGVNVWCAAGKGTFGTAELVRRVEAASLHRVVGHRRLVLPQLGAPGVAAHEVQAASGFRVHYGPVRVEDLPAYLRAGRVATPEMREVRFGLLDRAVLVPIELRPALKWFAAAAATVLALFTLAAGASGWRLAWPWLALTLAGVLAGTVVAPLALPILPGRAFSTKGLLAGLPVAAAGAALVPGVARAPLLAGFALLLFPALSSFLTLQFTGATTFTGLSGVRREMRRAVPLQAGAAALALALLVAHAVTAGGAR